MGGWNPANRVGKQGMEGGHRDIVVQIRPVNEISAGACRRRGIAGDYFLTSK